MRTDRAELVVVADRVMPLLLKHSPPGADNNRVTLISLLPERTASGDFLRSLKRALEGNCSPDSSSQRKSPVRRVIVSNDRLFIEAETLQTCQDHPVVGGYIRPAALITVCEPSETATRERLERAAQCVASVRAGLTHGAAARLCWTQPDGWPSKPRKIPLPGTASLSCGKP